MKALTIRNLLLSIAVVCFSLSANAQAKKKADKATVAWRYELACVGTGVTGTYLIKVYSYSKKPSVAKNQAKKNAIHGIIFKGFGAGAKGCTSQQPLARNPNIEQEKADYFKDFFADGGKYMKFVSLSNDGAVGAGDVIKVSKKEYKVGIVVSVQKDLLRKDLEAAGIIKGLASGF